MMKETLIFERISILVTVLRTVTKKTAALLQK